MYGQKVISRRISAYESATGIILREVPIQRVRDLVTYIEGRHDAKGKPIRPVVTPEIRRFIDNELAMCKANFRYWVERYVFIQYRTGMGGVDLFAPLESQLILLDRMAKDEEHMWERKDAGDRSFDGLLYFIHKARQLGFTTLCQLLLLHRTLFYADYKTLTASADDQKTQDTHAKWDMAYTRLPYWMRTPFVYKEKDRGKWLANGSYASLQDFAQEAGLGQGNTWDGFHLTEVASVPDPVCNIALENHFFNAVPRSLRATGFLESTAQGYGNWWHRATEQARRHEYGRWGYVFIPWYAEKDTYSRPDVPVGWSPDQETLNHAKKIEVTSPEFMSGRSVTPTREQLYWYETERESKRKSGAIAEFLTNFPADPEESFQYIEHGAFDSEKIYLLSNRIDVAPVAYELVRNKHEMDSLRLSGRILTGSDAPKVYSVGSMDLVPVATTDRDSADPRGLLLMYERPRLDVVYSIGVDTAGGIVGWLRSMRKSTNDELRVDNSCATVWYREPKTGLVRQAAEIAGPIAPREFAPWVLALGRLFHGANPQELGAPLIIEIQPAASGAQVQQILQYEYGYYNFYRWKTFNGMEVKETNSWGWVSNQSSVRLLWRKGKDYIENPQLPVRPRSRNLLQEMSACRWDPLRLRGAAPEGGGIHDDRVSAMLFALWQLFDWSLHSFATPQKVSSHSPEEERLQRVDFQQRDLASYDDYDTAVGEWYDRMLGSR